MTALMILACLPLGFVLADVVRDWRKLFREINGDSLVGLPPAPPRWQVYLAYAVATVLLIITKP